MGALLQHLALTKDIDDVGTLDGSETVRHGHRGPALGHALEGCLDEFLALCYFSHRLANVIWETKQCVC